MQRPAHWPPPSGRRTIDRPAELRPGQPQPAHWPPPSGRWSADRSEALRPGQPQPARQSTTVRAADNRPAKGTAAAPTATGASGRHRQGGGQATGQRDLRPGQPRSGALATTVRAMASRPAKGTASGATLSGATAATDKAADSRPAKGTAVDGTKSRSVRDAEVIGPTRASNHALPSA